GVAFLITSGSAFSSATRTCGHTTTAGFASFESSACKKHPPTTTTEEAPPVTTTATSTPGLVTLPASTSVQTTTTNTQTGGGGGTTTAPLRPTPGQTVVLFPHGVVFIKLPGTNTFVPLLVGM